MIAAFAAAAAVSRQLVPLLSQSCLQIWKLTKKSLSGVYAGVIFDTCVLFSLIPHSQEAIFKFVACLRQHAALRNVADGAYWVCAYANNQHRLKECQTLLWAMSLGEFRMVQTTGLATG